MADLPAFQRSQFDFTAHLRDPEHVSAPENVEDRRIAIYRDLLFNNVCGFLNNGFPILKSIYSEQDWKVLSRKFFSTHRSHSPYFLEISEEFLDFLENEYEQMPADPDFLLELAHYEWIELALMTSRETLDISVDRNGDLLESVPVLSPLAECLSYQWPVQHISKTYQPEAPLEQPQFMIVYRNEETDEVGFMEANPVTARLFELIRDDGSRTGRQLLEQIVKELQHPDPQIVIQGGHQILLKLHHAFIIPGTKASS